MTTQLPSEISALKLPQKVLDGFVKKMGSIEKLFEKVKELTDQTKAIGVSEEDLPKAVTHRLMTYFSKSTVKLEKFEIIPITVNVSDFGNKKKYDDAIKMFRQNPEVALKSRLVDKNGNPIEEGRFGTRKINPETKKSYEVMCRKEGEQNFKQVRLNVNNSNTTLALFALYDVDVTVNIDKQTKILTSLSLVEESTFTHRSNLSYKDVQTLIGQSNIRIAKKEEYDEIIGLEKFTLCYFWGSLRPNGFVIGSGGINNRISLCPDIDLESIEDISEIESIDCWIPELAEYPGKDRRIIEGAINILAIGRLSRSKDRGNLTMNVQGIWIDPRFIETTKATPIGPNGPMVNLGCEK